MPEIIGYVDILTVEGDTFDALALQHYSEETKASLIMQANPDHCGTLIFEAGVALRVPIVEDVELPETLPPWRREA